MKSEQLQEHLTNGNTKYKFYLPQTSWWEGHFDRLVEVNKQVLVVPVIEEKSFKLE